MNVDMKHTSHVVNAITPVTCVAMLSYFVLIKKKFVCKICNKGFRYTKGALDHENLHTGYKPFYCEKCDRSFALSASLRDHIKYKHSKTIKEEKMLSCEICSKQYRNRSGLLGHYSSKHKELGVDYTVACDICGKTFSRRSHLNRHELTHTGFRPFECNICNKSFSKKDSLDSHTRVHTGEKPYVCNHCNKSFAHGGSYRYHLKTHTGEVSHFCLHCNKGYISSGNLRNHMRTCRVKDEIKSEIYIKTEPFELGGNEKPKLECKVCNKVFKYARSALEHENMHTGDKPFKCDQCDHSYPLSSSLRVHIKQKHSGTEEKTHPCVVCSKVYQTESGLLRHYSSNHKELGYDCSVDCDICKRTFCSTSQLNRHKLTHTGFRPYECNICNKGFSKKDTLKIHQRVHTREKPYVCEYCNKRYFITGFPGFPTCSHSQGAFRCNTLTMQDIHRFHQKFNENKNKVSQDNFILLHTALEPIQRRRPSKNPSITYKKKRELQETRSKYFILDREERKVPVCMQTFLKCLEISRHRVNLLSKKKKFKCNICTKKLKNERDALEHKNLHTGDKPFKCDQCDRIFPLSSSLRVHKKKKHSKTLKEKVRKCVVCSKEYKSHSGLLRHYSSSHKELGYDYTVDCDICGKTCRTKCQLKKHQLTHTGFKRFECHICNNGFTKKDALEAHNRSAHTGEKPYVCDYCDKRFAQRAPYLYHLKLHTGERSHFCVNCKKGYITLSNLRSHMKNCRVKYEITSEIDIKSEAFEKKKFKCNICTKKLKNKRDALEHKNLHTGDKPFKCDQCDRSFPLSSSLRVHKKEKHSKTLKEKVRKCVVCSKEYKSHSGLLLHYSSSHKELGYDYTEDCAICGKTCRTKAQLKIHELTHTGFKRFECHICNNGFTKKDALEAHNRSAHTGEKPYVCDYCDKRFAQRAPYLYHLKLHTGERSHFCVNCKKGYITLSNLRSHMKNCRVKYEITSEIDIKSEPFEKKKFKCSICTKEFKYERIALEHENLHTGDKPFKCEQCDRSYPLSTTLRDHKKKKHSQTSTEEKMHSCVVCSKEYKSDSGLLRHYSSNHKELGYDYSVACDICKKTFSTRNELKVHELTHTGLKPHECNICHKSFSKKDTLKAHQRVHTGEKPYVCKYCDKKFAQTAPYLYHLKTHTGERSHFCVNCKKGYISLSNLRFHMKKCHEINIKSEIDIKSEPLELVGE
uniref:Zinc finger protein 208-like n=1 Tax=Diabrotica virgifera virgifera TaxID=50390 RepID=A0A6P7F4L7_DIAVI